jgi:branched-chain amino acid aminotransferase
VPLAEAKLEVMTHAFHYGTAVFEGIRGNWNSQHQQIYLFRLKEHYQRLQNGCRVLKVDLPYTIDRLCQITLELVQKCGFQEDIYIRPLAYKSAQSLGVRLHGLEDDLLVFTMPWGPYLDVDKARCSISSWRRPSETPQAKISGLYINNALAKTEANEKGFDEAIMLTADGNICEGSGENIFLVIEGQLVTPPICDNFLMGITRDTVITLARNELGLETVERHIGHSELYTADECFLTGTAAHITPVAEVDHYTIGSGEIGEVTGRLQELYVGVIRGNNNKYRDWCIAAYEK